MPVLTFSATVSGTVESFNRPAYIAALAAQFSGVSPDEITLQVNAAGVRRALAASPFTSPFKAAAEANTSTTLDVVADPADAVDAHTKRSLQATSQQIEVISRIAPANPTAITAAEAVINSFTPATLSAALGVQVASFTRPTIVIVQDIAPSPPPPSIPPNLPPPPPPPPLHPPSPPPPPLAEGSWGTTAAMGAAVGGLLLAGGTYMSHRRKQKRWGAAGGRQDGASEHDANGLPKLAKLQKADDIADAALPSWLRSAKEGSFPLPPASEWPTGGGAARKISDADFDSARSWLSAGRGVREALPSGQSPSGWSELSHALKFSEDGRADADDTEHTGRRRLDARYHTGDANTSLSFKDDVDKGPSKSMFYDVARDLQINPSGGISEITPEAIEMLAEQQAMRIETRRLEQTKRIEARRKQLAARQQQRQQAREKMSAVEGVSTTGSSPNTKDAYELPASLQVRALHKNLSHRSSHDPFSTHNLKERPGRVLRDGSIQPDALTRDNSALYSSADKERPSGPRVLRDPRQAPGATVKLGGTAQPYLSRDQSALFSSADKERPLRAGGGSGGGALDGSERSLAASRESARVLAEVEKKRAELEERRQRLAARKAARTGGDATAKPFITGAQPQPPPPHALERQNSALASSASKERPERRPERTGRPSSSAVDSSDSGADSSSPIARARPSLERSNSALFSSASKDGPRSMRERSTGSAGPALVTASSSVAASPASSARSLGAASSLSTQREELERRRATLAERKAARDAKAAAGGGSARLQAQQDGAVVSAFSPLHALERQNSALMSSADKERPERRPEGAMSTPASPQPPARLERQNSALASTSDKEAPPSRRPRGPSSSDSTAEVTSSAAATPDSTRSTSSERDALAERRRQLEERKAARVAAVAAVATPPGLLSRENSAMYSSADKERPASRRASAVAESVPAPVPPAALVRQNSALSSSADKERPESRHRPEAAPESQADSERSGASTQREQLEERRRQLEARKAERLALQAAATENKSAEPLKLSRDNSAMHSSADKERPASRRASAVAESVSAPVPPAALVRQNSALSSSADKERPESRHRPEAPAAPPTGGKSPSDSARSASTTLSMREQLEERRRQLEDRKADRMAKQAQVASPPSAPHVLERENSALASSASKARPENAKRPSVVSAWPLPSLRASLQRDNSALYSNADKEGPEKRPSTPPTPSSLRRPVPPRAPISAPWFSGGHDGDSEIGGSEGGGIEGGVGASARSSTNSIQSQKEELAERRRALEARQAARLAAEAAVLASGGSSSHASPTGTSAAGTAAFAPHELSRDNSALLSSATKERPSLPTSSASSSAASSAKLDEIAERRRVLAARKAARDARAAGGGSGSGSMPLAALRRHNSALASGASKERPTSRREGEADVDDDHEA